MVALLDKIGPARVGELLVQTAGATEAQAKAVLALAQAQVDGGKPEVALATYADATTG